MKIHPRENPYQCAPCDKYFISWHHIKIHIQSHSWDNSYPFSLCGDYFYPQEPPKKTQKDSYLGKSRIYEEIQDTLPCAEFLKAAIMQSHDCAKYLKICANFQTMNAKQEIWQ